MRGSIWFGKANTLDRATALSAKGKPASALSNPTPELARRTSSSARGFHEPALLLRELGRRLGRSRGHAVIGPPAEERDGVLRVKPAPLPPAHLFQQEGGWACLPKPRRRQVAEHVCAEVSHRQFVPQGGTIPKRLRIYHRLEAADCRL